MTGSPDQTQAPLLSLLQCSLVPNLFNDSASIISPGVRITKGGFRKRALKPQRASKAELGELGEAWQQ